MTVPRPALDPGLRTRLADMPLVARLGEEILAQLRQLPSTPVDSLLARRAGPAPTGWPVRCGRRTTLRGGTANA
ncbi:hypothetical protein [Streptomyces sp. Vc74B-19]|uniref:hypothetical protein n=1 Tax=Streptomyces sp. Vc74B-19 TaxID=2741324 RepID=UPI00203E0DF5|nr:hypothetical protein [Streptomyces sp. Vc74B-19]